jgi:integrase
VLNLYRRHGRNCGPKDKDTGIGANNGKRAIEGHGKGFCPSKPPCWIYYEGIDGEGRVHNPQNLIDPGTGRKLRDWNRACEIIRGMELPTPPEPVQKVQTSLDEAITAFRELKKKKGDDVQRKTKLLLTRLREFLGNRYGSIISVAEITLPDLITFRNTWTDQNSTQRRNQEIVKAFFNFCVDADYITKSPAKKLDPIPEDRPNTEPFEVDEIQRIFEALPKLEDEYGRQGGPIAAQTMAFVYVMYTTGLSIGDTAKLDKSAVHRATRRIRTHREKTGEEVFAKVPQVVIDALEQAPHDSDQYFFWSGEGKIHTRTSKWGNRLQKLFVLANVRTREVQKRRRSGGVLKTEPETVIVSEATPHMFRHTFARNWLESGRSIEDLAKLLGNSVRTIEKYYSKWDKRRQSKLEVQLDDMWIKDPITNGTRFTSQLVGVQILE